MNKTFLWFHFLRQVRIPLEICSLTLTKIHLLLFHSSIFPFSFHSFHPNHPTTDILSEESSQEAEIKKQGVFSLQFTDRKKDLYLYLFDAVLGRQTPCAVQAVDTTMRWGRTEAVFGWRTCRENRNCPRKDRCLLSFRRRYERRG